MTEKTDVAIVGAGPYGLSVGAHLRAAGLRTRQFGSPMRLWRGMPRGMFLKSQGFASNLSDPAGTHTLAAFCAKEGLPYRSYGLPIPLDTFISYGQWFADQQVPGLETTIVTGIGRAGGQYEIELADGERLQAGRVVIAAGVEHFPWVPGLLAALPHSVCTHSSEHADLAALRGQSVIVVGAGQSALESAALLHENGVSVRVVARRPRLAWNGDPLAPDRPLLRRLAEPEAGLGSGWGNWFYSERPGLFRHLPEASRVHRARTALGPAGACWLRDRVTGQFPVLTGHTVTGAAASGSGARLRVAPAGGSERELTADHVIAATGYRPDLRRLAFLRPEVRSMLRTVAGSPWVGAGYETSLSGLFIVGPAVAPTYGPVMRFVYGARHAATSVAGRLDGSASAGPRMMATAGRS
jgi:FAD-dependent urate hydroxylase